MILPAHDAPIQPVHDAAPTRIRRTPDSGRAIAPTDPDHPARRLKCLGAHALSTRELLTLLLDPGRGHARAADAADRLLTAFTHQDDEAPLRRLSRQPAAGVARIAGIGTGPACRLLAALDLARRMTEETRATRCRIRSALDVFERMHHAMRNLVQEEVRLLLLDTQNQVLREVVSTRGTLDASLIHPREVFAPALTESASSLILVHNHPSGEPTPSPEDKAVTTQLAGAGAIVGIPLLDHVIIGEGRYFSFVESGLLPSGD